MKIDSKFSNLTIEQGVLVLVLVLLSGAALYKAFTYTSVNKAIVGRPTPPPLLKDPKLYADVSTGLRGAPVVKVREHNLFIPRLITFNPSDGSIKVLDWNKEGIDGIPPVWKQKYGFPLDDPAVATSDPDADGYNNKEEYDAKTDPNDKASAPPVINKLFVKSYNPVQLQIIFKGYNETEPGTGVFEYQINTPTLAKRSWRLKEGEIIKVDDFNKYIIGKFREVKKTVKVQGMDLEREENFSELDVMDPRLNETITLLFNKSQNSDQSSVGFELLVPGESPEPASVNIGQKFKVRDIEYQLRRVDDGAAIILDLTSMKEMTIPKLGTASVPAPEPVPVAP